MAIQCDCYLTRLVGVDKPCPHFRMHDLPRIAIRADMPDDLKALVAGYNDHCERVEDLWTELDLQALEQAEEKAKKRKRKACHKVSDFDEDATAKSIQDEIAREIETLGETEI